MAIAKGNETKEVSFKRYTGIGNVNVLAINPTKAELAKLGREVEEEPVYVTEKDGVKSIRLSLYVKPIEVDEILTMSFFSMLPMTCLTGSENISRTGNSLYSSK